MTKLEEVARAIYEKRNGVGCTPWGRLPRSHKEPYLDDARAAVGALREPSARMLDAVGIANRGRDRPLLKSPGEAQAALLVWPTMIDSILSESE